MEINFPVSENSTEVRLTQSQFESLPTFNPFDPTRDMFVDLAECSLRGQYVQTSFHEPGVAYLITVTQSGKAVMQHRIVLVD